MVNRDLRIARIAEKARPKGSMVRFENVGMRYGAGPEVLRDVSFALDPGSFTYPRPRVSRRAHRVRW